MIIFCIPEFALGLKSGREGDCVVEGETERLVGLVVTLTSVKEVLLQVISDGEE